LPGTPPDELRRDAMVRVFERMRVDPPLHGYERLRPGQEVGLCFDALANRPASALQNRPTC
jgi:hypothetical protein